jgi:hypothetical protein
MVSNAVVMTGYLNWHEDILAPRSVHPLGR